MFPKAVLSGLCSAILLFAGWQPAAAQGDQAARAEAIKAYVDARVEVGLFEGVILVAQGEEILFHQAYGLADRRWSTQNSTNTRFHIGSVGKQMTAAIILQLVEEGKLDLDLKVFEVLPDYPKAQGSLVPVHTLLNHTSGIPTYTRMAPFLNRAASPISRAELVSQFSEEPLDFEPGGGFSYNNSGYYLLSLIIEKLEGKPYSQVIQDRLFGPLGLTDTGYINDRAIIPQFARAYQWSGSEYVEEVPTHESWILGNAMIYSDADDLLRWTLALQKGAIFSDPTSRGRVFDLPAGAERNYAFGMGNVPIELNGKTFRGNGHSGALGGFRSTQSLIPEMGWSVIVLSNIGIDQNDMADNVLRILAGEDVDLDLKPISFEIGQRLGTANSANSGAIRRWFEEELSREIPRFSFDEGGMNNLGYALLAQSRIEEAVLVLSLNTIVHPQSANTFDSLGEAYLLSGDTARALSNYSRSLELDPSNTNAERKIEELRASGELE
ncbi:MAG: serine hydrolase [Pseudomonadota bacterium]